MEETMTFLYFTKPSRHYSHFIPFIFIFTFIPPFNWLPISITFMGDECLPATHTHREDNNTLKCRVKLNCPVSPSSSCNHNRNEGVKLNWWWRSGSKTRRGGRCSCNVEVEVEIEMEILEIYFLILESFYDFMAHFFHEFGSVLMQLQHRNSHVKRNLTWGWRKRNWNF